MESRTSTNAAASLVVMGDGDGEPDVVGQPVAVLSGIEDHQPGKVEVVECRPHGRRDARRVDAFDLEAEPAPAAWQIEVEFRAVLGAPEVHLGWLQRVDNTFHDQPLPRCSRQRMPQQCLPRVDTEQAVAKAAVAHVDLW
jgi:hypothetical protein